MTILSTMRVLTCALAATIILAHDASAQDANGIFIETSTARLWTLDSGGPGPTVILLHTNTGTVERWSRQIAALKQAGFRAIAFDREGSGKSTTKPGAKPSSIAEDIDAIADQLHLKQFSLVGEAGGGYAALDYAAWKPKKVRSLVIASSGAGVTTPETKKFRDGAAIPGFDAFPAEVKELSPTYRGTNPDGVKKWLSIEKTAAQGAAANPVLHTPNTMDKIESIHAPTLVIAADVDLQTPVGAIRIWARHLKSYKFSIIPESGHAVSWEQPKAFDHLMIAFLRGHRK